MNYDRTLLELLEKVKELEERIERLEQPSNIVPASPVTNGKSLTQQARDYILDQKNKALSEGESSITLLCNDIQKALGITNRTPCICTAMYDCMKPGDEVLSAPASGKSTTVLIKYYLSNRTEEGETKGSMTYRQLKTDFENYFYKKKPNYKYPGPLFGMAFYCTRHDIGVTLEDLFSGRVSLDDYEEILRDTFTKMGSINVTGRASAYKDAMKNLLEYVSENHLENIKIQYQ